MGIYVFTPSPVRPAHAQRDQRLRPSLALLLPDIPKHLLPGGFDCIGDIALLTLPKVIRPQAGRIGKAILKLHAHLHVVALRQGNYSGAQRLIDMQVVAGENRLTTLHRENGVALSLDLGRTYFSTRLAGERLRLAQLVQRGEKVCVLCSGTGPYPLVIAQHSQASEIHGVEINPAAHACAVHNRQINGFERAVHLHLGEAAPVLAGLKLLFDRVVVMLPWHADSLFTSALSCLRAGGTLHCYAMETSGQPSSTLYKLDILCKKERRDIHSVKSVRCGHCGPKVYRTCHDVVIS